MERKEEEGVEEGPNSEGIQVVDSVGGGASDMGKEEDVLGLLPNLPAKGEGKGMKRSGSAASVRSNRSRKSNRSAKSDRSKRSNWSNGSNRSNKSKSGAEKEDVVAK